MKIVNRSLRLSFLLFVLNSNLFAQNQISLSIASPMQHPGMDKFYNDNWIIGSKNRTTYKTGINLEFLHQINEDFFIGIKAGIGYRINHEFSYDTVYYEPVITNGNINMVAQSGGTEIKFRYSQFTFNINPIAYWQKNLDRFLFGFGIGPSFGIYGTGHNYYSYRETIFDGGYLPDGMPDPNHLTADIPKYRDFSVYEMKIAKGYCFGLNLLFKSSVQLNEKFSIFAMIDGFYHYMFFTGNTKTDFTYDNLNVIPGIVESGKTNFQEKEDFRQLTFSNLLPSVGLTYKW
jgi:hypothetical protein